MNEIIYNLSNMSYIPQIYPTYSDILQNLSNQILTQFGYFGVWFFLWGIWNFILRDNRRLEKYKSIRYYINFIGDFASIFISLYMIYYYYIGMKL